MKNRFFFRYWVVIVTLVSVCSMTYLEMEGYCKENGVEISDMIENGEIKTMLLPDVFIVENIIKSLFNLNI